MRVGIPGLHRLGHGLWVGNVSRAASGGRGRS
jgi:hypothetical protein